MATPSARRPRRRAGGRTTAAGRGAVLAVLLVACNPSVAPIPPPSRVPRSTPDVRIAAADTYITAATAYHAAIDPVQKTVCATANTTPALRNCWSRKLVIQRTFDSAVAAIAFPADMRADVSTFRYVVGRLESAMAGIAAAPAPARDLPDLGVFSSASVDFLQVSSNLRAELGIVSSPSSS